MKLLPFPHLLLRKHRILSVALCTIAATAFTIVMPVSVRPSSAAAAYHHAARIEVKGTPEMLMPANARKSAPYFTLVDAQERPITLSEYRGSVVLLDFWATWCGGCKLEIPWYMEFDKKYKNRGLVAIGISMDADGWKTVRPFLAQKRIRKQAEIQQ